MVSGVRPVISYSASPPGDSVCPVAGILAKSSTVGVATIMSRVKVSPNPELSLTRKNSDVPEGVALQLPLPVEPKPMHKKMEKLGSLKTLSWVCKKKSH